MPFYNAHILRYQVFDLRGCPSSSQTLCSAQIYWMQHLIFTRAIVNTFQVLQSSDVLLSHWQKKRNLTHLVIYCPQNTYFWWMIARPNHTFLFNFTKITKKVVHSRFRIINLKQFPFSLFNRTVQPLRNCQSLVVLRQQGSNTDYGWSGKWASTLGNGSKVGGLSDGRSPFGGFLKPIHSHKPRLYYKINK